MFCNLHFLNAFRDHKFSDFWVGSTTGAEIDRKRQTNPGKLRAAAQRAGVSWATSESLR